MLALLPAACFVVLLAFVSAYRRILSFGDANRRTCFVIAFGLFQILTVAFTEASSAGRHYTRLTITLMWTAALLALGLAVLRSGFVPHLVRAARLRDRSAASEEHPRHALRRRRAVPTVRIGSVDAAAGLLVLVAMFAALGRMSAIYPPSNGDSMAYHLVRVEHWIQNSSVAAYPAHFLAQVELPPLMEYNLATLHLLAGTDRLDGFVQLTAVAVCVLGASELARRLGLGRRGQIVTALLVITAPNFLLQATSTTNDDFNAAVGITVLCVATASLGDAGWKRRSLALGALAGLVEMSKSTLFALLGPAMLVVLVFAVHRSWKEYGTRTTVKRSLAAVGLALVASMAVAGPFLARNFALFSAPGGPVARSTIVNHASPSNAASNLLRQVSAQFLIGDGHGFENAVSSAVVRPLGWIYDGLGQDPHSTDYAFQPNPDPFTPGDFSTLTRFEDVGANPWHTLLILASVVVLVGYAMFGSRRQTVRLPLLMAAALCVGFVAFGITAKWSIYATRYYIPLLVAWSPIVAVALARLPKVAVRIVCAALVVACLPQLLDNYERPLVHTFTFRSPLESYFVTEATSQQRESKAADYQHLAETLARSKCREVGIANQVVVEYPIWIALDLAHWKGVIQHVDVHNASSRIVERPGFRPCALIYQPDQRGYVDVHPGMRQMTFGNLTMFVDVNSLN